MVPSPNDHCSPGAPGNQSGQRQRTIYQQGGLARLNGHGQRPDEIGIINFASPHRRRTVPFLAIQVRAGSVKRIASTTTGRSSSQVKGGIHKHRIVGDIAPGGDRQLRKSTIIGSIQAALPIIAAGRSRVAINDAIVNRVELVCINPPPLAAVLLATVQLYSVPEYRPPPANKA